MHSASEKGGMSMISFLILFSRSEVRSGTHQGHHQCSKYISTPRFCGFRHSDRGSVGPISILAIDQSGLSENRGSPTTQVWDQSGHFTFLNISMFMINQIKWSMFWSVIFVRYKIWRPYAIGERWQPKECSVMQTFCVLGGSSHLFTARKFVPPVQILGANSWCSTILMKLFWRKPENVSGERRLVCAIKRVPQCTQPTNKKTFYITSLIYSTVSLSISNLELFSMPF